MNTAICAICQHSFERRSNAIYCGPECKKAARREQSHTPEGRERARGKKARQRERNPEHQRALVRSSHARHREQRNEDTKNWYKQHPGYRKTQSQKWRRMHPVGKRLDTAQYYQTHKEQISARVVARLRANPLLRAQANSRARARRLNASGKWTSEEFKELCEQVDYHCAYCHRRFIKLTPDHILPLSRGGSNDIANIIPACKSCNYSKQDKTPLEYLIRFYIP